MFISVNRIQTHIIQCFTSSTWVSWWVIQGKHQVVWVHDVGEPLIRLKREVVSGIALPLKTLTSDVAVHTEGMMDCHRCSASWLTDFLVLNLSCVFVVSLLRNRNWGKVDACCHPFSCLKGSGKAECGDNLEIERNPEMANSHNRRASQVDARNRDTKCSWQHKSLYKDKRYL